MDENSSGFFQVNKDKKVVSLEIRVKTRSKTDNIQKFDSFLLVHVKAPPTKGKANKEILKLIKKTFSLKDELVIIAHGHTSTTKILEIHGDIEEIKIKLLR